MRPYFNIFFILIAITALPKVSWGQCVEPLFLQGPDSICAEKKDLVIKASRVANQVGVEYRWKIPGRTKDSITTDSILRIANPTSSYSGNYYVAIKTSTCPDSSLKYFGPVNVQVIGAKTALGSTIKTVISCNNSEAPLMSDFKTNNNVFGEWIGTEGVTFDQPKSPKTLVKNLKEGDNYAIWVLSTSVCPFFLRDTFLVRHEVKPTLETAGVTLRAGEASAVIHLGKVSGSNLDILKDVEIKITKPPRHGFLDTLAGGKRLKYVRNSDFSGRDAFEIIVCNLKCPNLCSPPIPYTIDVVFDERYPNVGMPKILIPNEAGEARQFLIEKIENYPKNELRILDRWGNSVQTFTDYKNQNAWEGSAKNGQLTGGAYYYFLQAYDKDGKPLRPLTGIFYLIQ